MEPIETPEISAYRCSEILQSQETGRQGYLSSSVCRGLLEPHLETDKTRGGPFFPERNLAPQASGFICHRSLDQGPVEGARSRCRKFFGPFHQGSECLSHGGSWCINRSYSEKGRI